MLNSFCMCFFREFLSRPLPVFLWHVPGFPERFVTDPYTLMILMSPGPALLSIGNHSSSCGRLLDFKFPVQGRVGASRAKGHGPLPAMRLFSPSDLQWKSGHMAESLTNMPRHSLYVIIGALCVAFVLMLIILIVGICRISRIEYQGSSRPAYEEFYSCRSIDSELSNALASIRHARWARWAAGCGAGGGGREQGSQGDQVGRGEAALTCALLVPEFCCGQDFTPAQRFQVR